MITVLIIALVGVMVLDIVVIRRAALRIRVERALKADPLSFHDPRPRPARRERLRWLEPSDASPDPGSRAHEHEPHG
jgi:hypothetical protein